MRPTLVIVDDHEDFRISARAMLEADGFDVIGEAADGEEALAVITDLRPTIVLLDIQLPGMDGLAVASQLASREAPPHVVLISSREAASYGPRLAGASARGFITKSELSGHTLSKLL
ncbi:MAG TPA: response regulator transcription factor [Acidimicrobiia bacterium]|nr:response regulator transcription factor [Acidimicrobiia bacterium]